MSGYGPSSRFGSSLRVLVVAGLLTGEVLREEDRAVRQVVMSLQGQCRDSEVTVLTTDPRSPVSAAAAFGQCGIKVMGYRGDWAGELAAGPFAYSHVFFTDAALQSPALQRVAEGQPQATLVFYFSGLPFRKVAALEPMTPEDERDGLEFVRSQAEAWLVAEVGSAHALWCEREDDVAYLASRLSHIPIAHIPPVIESVPGRRPLDERNGVVLVATDGHDVLGGNEDAALLAMREILPVLARRGCPANSTLVTDWPSPMLEAAAQSQGVNIVGSNGLSAALGGARLALVAHNYGSGGAAIVHAALATGTPFVASPVAAAGFNLGPLQQLAVRGGQSDVVERARELLSQDGSWHDFAAEADRFIARYRSEEVRAAAVRRALPALGIVPRPPVGELPRAGLGQPRRARRPVAVPLRPVDTAAPPPWDGPVPADPEPRYQLWSERFGPNPRVLRAIKADLEGLALQPTISILMPVYNTDPDVLLAAIDSVRAQIYGNWQLCIADDGSDRPETLELLKTLSGDSRVALTRLGGQSGISAATNAALALATGEWITLLDHDDLLKPHALAQVIRWMNADPSLDVIYSDEDKLDDNGCLVQPHLKPDWAPDQLMSHNYVCHLTVARRHLVEEIGGLRSEFDGSQDYDLVLRLADRSDHIAHIPEPLYTWRMVAGSTAVVAEAKPWALEAGRRALDAALERRGRAGWAEDTIRPGLYRTRYVIGGTPRVTIIIPTKDRIDLLRPCVESILDRSTYTNFEIIVIDNQSSDAETLEYLAHFPGRVLRYPYFFNYSRMMNLGARAARAEALLFLNNDTTVISPDWIQALLEHAMRPEVGAVGGRLYLGSGTPQHEGILVGVMGWANNIDYGGFWARGDVTRNVSAVTGACTMIRPDVYWAVGGNDERLRIAYNDVDLCLRIRQAGLEVVYTPYAELFHYHSSTRSGFEHRDDGPLFGLRWRPTEQTDPYYSPLLDPDRLFEIKL